MARSDTSHSTRFGAMRATRSPAATPSATRRAATRWTRLLKSAHVGLAPLLLLFVMLAVLRLPAWLSALAAMLTAALLAWLVWGLSFGQTVSATTQGMAFGLWPISWVVLNALFFHNLTVASGD